MATKTKENGEVDLEEAYRLVTENEQKKRQERHAEFWQKYQALCQEYGVQLVPGMTLKDL